MSVTKTWSERKWRLILFSSLLAPLRAVQTVVDRNGNQKEWRSTFFQPPVLRDNAEATEANASPAEWMNEAANEWMNGRFEWTNETMIHSPSRRPRPTFTRPLEAAYFEYEEDEPTNTHAGTTKKME